MGLLLPLIMIVNMRFGFYMTQKHQYLQDNVVHLKDRYRPVVREPGADYTTGSSDSTAKAEAEPTMEQLGAQAVKLCDEMENLHTLNSYFFIAIEGLVKDVEILTEEVLFGLWLNMRWLHERSEEVRAAVRDLHTTIRDTRTADTDQEEALE